MTAEARRQINIAVSPKMHDALAREAAKSKMPVTTYAGLLFQAAASERLKPGCAPDLSDAIGRVAVLFGDHHFDTTEIARLTKLSEPTVVRIIDAWKAETAGRAA